MGSGSIDKLPARMRFSPARIVCVSSDLTEAGRSPALKAMKVHFLADKEARLRQFAARTGKDAEQVIEEGRASARRGDLLDHDVAVERIERILRP